MRCGRAQPLPLPTDCTVVISLGIWDGVHSTRCPQLVLATLVIVSTVLLGVLPVAPVLMAIVILCVYLVKAHLKVGSGGVPVWD
jgi:hypothetical protein